MARGWESKSVEDQIAAAEAGRTAGVGRDLTPAEREHHAKTSGPRSLPRQDSTGPRARAQTRGIAACSSARSQTSSASSTSWADPPASVRLSAGRRLQWVRLTNTSFGGRHAGVIMSTTVESVRGEYLRYKALAEAAIDQLDEAQLSATGPGGNSIAVICWHVSGNLRSRFTDFLSSDGEKPWRHREEEFQARHVSRAELLEKWNAGWTVLLETLAALSDAELGRTVTIRQQPLSVNDALHRSLAHTSYHVGQIVYVAKALRGADWKYLSIPPGESDTYNASANRDRPADSRSLVVSIRGTASPGPPHAVARGDPTAPLRSGGSLAPARSRGPGSCVRPPPSEPIDRPSSHCQVAANPARAAGRVLA